MKIFNNTYQAIVLFDAPKIHTDLLWDLTMLLGGIALVYFAVIFFFRNRISGRSAKTSALKTSLSPMISEFIFYDETGSKEEKSIYLNLKVQIRDMLKDDFKRKTISDILLELRKDVSGAAQQRLFELFQELDLHKDSYKKLQSWRWERISSGIQELTQMEVNDAYSFLTKFVNDKRSTIRKQAEIAVVSLDAEGINFFMDSTRSKISEWQQLKLIEVLSNKTDFAPPSFKAWLVSKNKYVVLFALRLIKFYDQNDANTSIIELVKHRDNQIKQEVIDCIKAFYLTSALPILQQVFWGCSIDIKISILDTMANLGTPENIPFLQSIGNKERNYSVTSKALGAINAIAPDSVLPTEGITDIDRTVIPADIVFAEPNIEEQQKIDTEPEQKIEKESDTLADTNEAVRNISFEGEELEKDSQKELEDANISEDKVGRMGNGEDEKIKDTIAKDNNSIEVDFLTDFLPLVTSTQNNTMENQAQSESKTNAIEVLYEEVNEKYTPDITLADLRDPKNIEVVLNSEFLPLVLADQNVNEKTKDTDDIEVVFEQVTRTVAIDKIEEEKNIIENENEKIKDTDDIEVVFEQELSVEGKNTIEEEKNIAEIEVTYETLEIVSIEKETVLENINVVFGEVIPEKVEISFEMEEHLSEHFDFEIIFNNGQPPLRIPKVETADILDIEVNVNEVLSNEDTLSDIEVVCELEQGDDKNEEEDLPKWLLNEIANESANFNDREHLKMGGPEWDAKESEMLDQIKGYIKNIPNSDQSHDEVSEIMQLLDDIEIFGDEREIPLLQELMQKEDKTIAKERIDGLMKRFMGSDAYGQGPENTPSYSIFEELFRNCDTESKLILLDEIIMVGDEKEVLFLEHLLDDPEKDIRKKAASSLKALNERFKRVENGQESKDADDYERFINMMNLKPPKEEEPSYFKIDFDIDTEGRKEKQEMAEEEKGFFKYLSDFINKLIK